MPRYTVNLNEISKATGIPIRTVKVENRLYRITPEGREVNIGIGWSMKDCESVKAVWEKEYPEYKGRIFIGISS